jgi:hypothetical protein
MRGGKIRLSMLFRNVVSQRIAHRNWAMDSSLGLGIWVAGAKNEGDYQMVY